MASPVLTRQFDEERLATIQEPHHGPTMTVGGVASRTTILLALLVGAATWSWTVTTPTGRIPGGYWLLLAATVGLGIFTAVKPWWARWLAPVYAVAEGVLVGGISRIYEHLLDGVVGMAVAATLVTFTAMLALYASGAIRVGGRFRRFVVAATFGAAVFYVGAFLLSFTTGAPFLLGGGWVAVAISVVMIAIASFNLLIDFDAIDRGVAAGEPAELEWAAAFGLVITLVWIYLELLRLILILGGRE